MFDRIFGTYLVDNGKITKDQLKELTTTGNHVRVKLGMIAVSEKLMTSEQADEVNQLQAITDRRFGDIAVEKGYLTDEQVGELLNEQGNSFLHFLQAVIDKELYTIDELDEFLSSYQAEMSLTDKDMDALVSGDVLREVSAYLQDSDSLYSELCGVAIRTFLRLVDSNAYIEKAYVTNEFECDRFASQATVGDHQLVTGLGSDNDDLLCVAVPFGQEEFEEVDLDALDAVAEFINCVDGLFSSALSERGIDIDMCPPEFYDRKVILSGKEFMVLPIISNDKRISLVISVDEKLDAKFGQDM